MALALGTNVGFVTVAPTADPAGSNTTIDGSSVVVKDTSPTNALRITQIGWYRGAGTNTANFEVGLYSDLLGIATTRLFVDNTNSSAAGGWITTAVDWAISGSTAYWLGLQMDAHTGSSSVDTATSGGSGADVLTGQTALNDPYGGGLVADADGMYAIYALVELLTIAPTDVAISLSLDNATITQDHIIATQDIAISLGEDADTITQNHVITSQDVTISLGADNTTVEEDVPPVEISPADIALSLTIDNATITQNHLFSPDDIVFSLTQDNDTIAQNHVMATTDIGLGLSVDATTIAQNHILTTADLAISLAMDNDTILQDHLLVTQDALLGLATDNTTIEEQDNNITIITADVVVGLALDTTTIEQNHILTPSDVAISLILPSVLTIEVYETEPYRLLRDSRTPRPQRVMDTTLNKQFSLPTRSPRSNNFHR